MTTTKRDVIDRLTPIIKAAIANRSGLSLALSAAEQNVFSEADTDQLLRDTGYAAMCESNQPAVALRTFTQA